ncbi:transporter [Lithospermum erythrorhizon]|uniref:Transporter n=1 Tax=Lithospermum erythrorhizon TaxID=34254 RepID=A0AAV3RKR4_LITER
MEATLLASHYHLPSHFNIQVKYPRNDCCHTYPSSPRRTYTLLTSGDLQLNSNSSWLSHNHIVSSRYKRLGRNAPDDVKNSRLYIKAASAESLHFEQYMPAEEGEGENLSPFDPSSSEEPLQPRPKSFYNRLLTFLRLGSLLDNAAESFFKSEIRRRLFVTALLLVVSRVGYFIPLPGFDRRLIPENYLSFVSGSSDELGDFTPEIKLSLFQLGLSPQIGASIIMQVLCHVVPSLVKLRKEGLDGHEKIKSYIWWISLGFAVVEGLILSCYSLPHSIYAASYRVKHVMVTTMFLVCGAMTTGWICDKITESGFGQGSSLIICVGILTGYTNILHKMLTQLSGACSNCHVYSFALLVPF